MSLRHDFAIAGRKIVNHQNVVARGKPMLDQIRAEAARAAGDEDAHVGSAARFFQVRVAALTRLPSSSARRRPGQFRRAA